MENQLYHSVFRTPQLMPIANAQTIRTTTNTLSLKPLTSGKFRRVLVVSGEKRKVLVSKCSALASAGGVAALERCFTVTCAKKRGGRSGSIGTLEKPKVEKKPKQEKKPSPPEPETGGGGGDIGKKIYHGGGDGGDDDGGDDDYEFDDEDEGDDSGFFRRRLVFQELFGRKFVDAVLNEWQRAVKDLPQGLQEACQTGLVSSALLVKFLAMNARPSTVRFISRKLPEGMSRAFIGRMLADPAFIYKLLLEQAATIGFSVWWEWENRKGRIKEEWDLALINVLTTTACNAFVVWSLAPCRSYGNTGLQSALPLPNNIFEMSYPLREFDLQKRIQSFIYKALELCTVGAAAGAAQSALSHLRASKKDRLSVTIPPVTTNSLGNGAFLSVNANLRYQLLCGVDRTMMHFFDAVGPVLFFSTVFRLVNVVIGETLRLGWLRIEAVPSGANKGQGDPAADGEGELPKAQRKRIVKIKVAS